MSREHGHRLGRRVDAFVVAAAIAAAAVLTATAEARIDRVGPFVALVAAFALCKAAPVVAVRGRVLHTYTLAEAPLLVALVTLGRDDTVWAAFLGAAVGVAMWRPCWHKAVYNVSSEVLAVGAATLVSGSLAHRAPDAEVVLRLALAAFIACAVSSIALALVLAVAQGAYPRELLNRQSLRTIGASLIAATALGLTGVAVAEQPAVLPAFAVVVALVVAGGQAVERTRLAHDRTTTLVEAAARFEAAEERDALVDVLTSAAAAITGGDARLTVATSDIDERWRLRLPTAFAPAELLVAHSPGQHFPGDPSPLPALRTLVALAGVALEGLMMRSQLRDQAVRDPLTGVGNRRRFSDALDEARARAARGRPFAVLLADLDGFKAVNDTAGHEAGDAVLVAVAAALDAASRATDVVCRLGGDEFVVVADEITSTADCDALGRQLASAACLAAARAGHPEIGVSVGGAVWGVDSFEVTELVAAADRRMYASKTSYAAAPVDG